MSEIFEAWLAKINLFPLLIFAFFVGVGFTICVALFLGSL